MGGMYWHGLDQLSKLQPTISCQIDLSQCPCKWISQINFFQFSNMQKGPVYEHFIFIFNQTAKLGSWICKSICNRIDIYQSGSEPLAKALTTDPARANSFPVCLCTCGVWWKCWPGMALYLGRLLACIVLVHLSLCIFVCL